MAVVRVTRSVGMLLLGIWLLLSGLAGIAGLAIPAIVMAVLAIVAGILIVIGQ